MPATHNKTERLEARVDPEVLELLRHAAELQGRSVSDFVLAAAQEAASRVIEEGYAIRLSMQDQRRFAEALIDPPALVPAMERAGAAHNRLIRASR